MNSFNFINTDFEGARIIEPFYSTDNRGFFSKVYENDVFSENGINLIPYEEFFSFSKKGVIRGMHFQRKNCQDKLVQVLNGAIYDVIVDLRKNSDTYGKWQGFFLNKENRKLIYIPKGFAHGFLSLENETLVNYICGSKYDYKTDDGILWNDETIGIEWPLGKIDEIIISERDSNLQKFNQFKEKYGSLI